MNVTSAAVPTYRKRERPNTIADVIAEEQEKARRKRIKAARKARRRARKARVKVARAIVNAHGTFAYVRLPHDVAALVARYFKRFGYVVECDRRTAEETRLEFNLKLSEPKV